MAALPAGCLCPPSDEALLAVGYRTPEQTVESFQTGVRADEPYVEYACLSSGFVRRNRLSKLIWLEFRDELFGRHPFLRTGLAKAEVESVETDGARSRLVMTSYGRRFELELVREDFRQLYVGPELVHDEEFPFASSTSVQPGDDRDWLTGGVPLPDGVDGDTITELRLGREWKIDDFRGELPEAGDAASP